MKVYIIIETDRCDNSIEIKVYGNKKKAEAELEKLEKQNYISEIWFNLEEHLVR